MEIMSRKRRNTSSAEPEDAPELKRQRSLSLDDDDESEYESGGRKEQPQVDPLFGQAGAFPGLSNGDELFYGPASDGIDYLRMVR